MFVEIPAFPMTPCAEVHRPQRLGEGTIHLHTSWTNQKRAAEVLIPMNTVVSQKILVPMRDPGCHSQSRVQAIGWTIRDSNPGKG